MGSPQTVAMETCAGCGQPIVGAESSFYVKGASEDIGRTYHARCGSGGPSTVKAAVAAERERCAEIVEKFEASNPKRRHPRTNAMFQRLAEAIRKEP